MSVRQILVVDDNRDLARGVALVISELGCSVEVVHSAEEAIERLEKRPVDLVLSDVRMPGMDGLALHAWLREKYPRTRVVLFTGYGTIEAAVEAMKLGAFDYLTKPLNNDELVMVARRALKQLDDEDELDRLRAELAATQSFRGIYSRDRRMLQVFDAIRRVAPSNASVLVQGESGTGKELVARAIHEESARAQKPFVAFNAAAIPENLAEAELFGARKGAYTGADRDRKGLFVEADGGTLFIDEVSSMPAAVQGKLLRALQEREVLPLGASAPCRVDVRIVAASNVEPQRLLREKLLRQDLYYRLAVARISLPPLRERVEDIPLLAGVFLERLAAGSGGAPKQLSAPAMRLLLSYDWPGNVRELQNVIERAALMSREAEIRPLDIQLEEDVLDWSLEEEGSLAYEEAKRRVLDRFQRRYVEHCLSQTGGNMAAAARMAGITRAALHRIVKRLGIDDSEDEPQAPEPRPPAK